MSLLRDSSCSPACKETTIKTFSKKQKESLWPFLRSFPFSRSNRSFNLYYTYVLLKSRSWIISGLELRTCIQDTGPRLFNSSTVPAFVHSIYCISTHWMYSQKYHHLYFIRFHVGGLRTSEEFRISLKVYLLLALPFFSASLSLKLWWIENVLLFVGYKIVKKGINGYTLPIIIWCLLYCNCDLW